MMDKALLNEKLNMWRQKLVELEKELLQIQKHKGEAAQEGDLRENAAYQMASEDADTWRVRIDEVRKIIADLEKEKGGKS
ncbi:hypothetical protein HY387_01500 [Candidatus Daviesbacteria bacterium]|nr:hypothetical protein [Candidatus Daviesbacteria bacterium]